LELSNWLKIYGEICRELELVPEKDRQAAELLSDMIAGKCLRRDVLSRALSSSPVVVVFGAGPSLQQDLAQFSKHVGVENVVTIAADGASKAFTEIGLTPHVVFTDLDGGDETLTQVNRNGALLVVHAHGDNIDRQRRLVPMFKNPVLGTTQTEPVGCLENFGGFTDGDRAVYACLELGVERIVLAGMDFTGEVGPYSKPYPLNQAEIVRKKRKLLIGKRLLELLAREASAELYDASASYSRIEGFRKLDWEGVRRIIQR
jgi:uncharacterized Rossmann fold enzyme